MNNVEISRYSKRLLQLFWDPIPKNDDDSPIWCLGKSYDSKQAIALDSNKPKQTLPSGPSSHGSHVTSPGNDRQNENTEDSDVTRSNGDEGDDDGWPGTFLDDFEARIWLTYRSDFPPIPKSQDAKALSAMSLSVRLKNQFNQIGFKSDSGWGCMIRSGQCVLANTLFMLQLGRDWRRGTNAEDEQRILSLFADDPSAPFSIHRFVEHGAQACGKHPGEWFGPSATARCIQALTNEFSPSRLRVYITGDGSDVYEDSFFKVAKPTGTFQPTLVLVGIRLGIDRVTPVYWEALKSSLQMPQSVGIAGGRPASSHYFIGTQGDHFFYLDPHYTRPFLPFHTDPSLYTTEDIDSCHTRRLHRIHIKEMDPSMLIAFLIHDEADWKKWRTEISCVQGKAVVNVADFEPIMHGDGMEREGAIDEVETLDDEEDGGLL